MCKSFLFSINISNNMFKKNSILVGCLALLLALSVGFALFSERITINGTASAKGSFGLATVCEKGYSSALVNAGIYGSTDENQSGFNADSCNVTGNKVGFESGLDSPGAQRQFNVKVTNTGTIDAMVDKSKVTGEQGVANLVTKVCPILENGEPSTTCTNNLEYKTENNIVQSKNIYLYELVAFETNGIVCSLGDDCVTNYINDNDDILLKAGSSAYYTVGFYWPGDYESGYDNGFKATATMDIPFIQVTTQ